MFRLYILTHQQKKQKAFVFSKFKEKEKMKKLLFSFLVLLIAVNAYAIEGSIGSGEKTSDTAIIADATGTDLYITALQIITDGTNDAKVILHDHATAASGTVIAEITVSGADNYGGRVWKFPRHCINGIYGDVTGTGASFIVEYTQK